MGTRLNRSEIMCCKVCMSSTFCLVLCNKYHGTLPVFWNSAVQILCCQLAVLFEGFLGFPQSIKANVGIVL
jgi:hypothetical protein